MRVEDYEHFMPQLRNLWIEVIAQAVRDYQLQDEDGEDARAFIDEASDPEEVGSFAWICEIFELNAPKLAYGIRKFAAANDTKWLKVREMGWKQTIEL